MRPRYFINATTLLSIAGALNIFERQTDVCKWSLAPDDCICMNSMNGAIMKDPTSTCCTDMGLKTSNLVSHPPACPPALSRPANVADSQTEMPC
ncbi:hypothetical protein SAMD00023353_1201650 [Rosellinia necatrix]|uniref:Uncharacterized protein n=1 Tax=Rosellinia necatrix TaxID=77044 RepID=A0A1S8A7N5_ROSNE|nr:hypothetical protein SAMD00023353_1201650 [Rosellinia necatrix]